MVISEDEESGPMVAQDGDSEVIINVVDTSNDGHSILHQQLKKSTSPDMIINSNLFGRSSKTASPLPVPLASSPLPQTFFSNNSVTPFNPSNEKVRKLSTNGSDLYAILMQNNSATVPTTQGNTFLSSNNSDYGDFSDGGGSGGRDGKKMSKPMIEKKRRDRMNKCLNMLKHVIIDSKQYPVANVSLTKLVPKDQTNLDPSLTSLTKVDSRKQTFWR